jgi:hypothetical protein
VTGPSGPEQPVTPGKRTASRLDRPGALPGVTCRNAARPNPLETPGTETAVLPRLGPEGACGAYSRACRGSTGISRAAFSARSSAFICRPAVPQQRSYWFCQSVMNVS